ncbi:GNAT family N-acetyltransferase [Halobacillus sp. Marseille-P3879]|uniref:GNAT family N-acetyltransferase n=1 Tax=Halobacillus sp. Marseille-P3879 TaxID=2045014 RepID=UPI000C7AF063|nr:GNAT family N-acetyltransferase [Halobacillus sp. Marseille-P3879]
MENICIEEMVPSDWKDVRRIYLEGIASGHATFETAAPSWEKWNASHSSACRFVARIGDTVAGWSALKPVSARSVYAGVAEVSVYVGKRNMKQGVGSRLMESVVKDSEARGFWTLQAGIFPENKASLQLHKRAGFREVGRRERIGKMEGVWRDIILMERRSSIAGI